MRCLLRLLILVVIVGALAVVGAAWAGVVQVPVVSALVGMDKPADLGAATPDVAAYEAWVKKYGLVHTSPDANYTLSSHHEFAGSYALDAIIPEGVILATRTLRGNAPGIHDVTVKFHDGSATAAAFFDAGPYGYPVSGPVKVDFRVTVTGPRAVTVSIDSLQFGRIGVPAEIVAKAQDALNGYLVTRLAGIDGLQVDTLAFVDGGVQFKGTLPKTFGSDPPAPGALP